MELVKKDTLQGKKLSDFNLYKEFIMEVIKKIALKSMKDGIEVSNNFFGGMTQHFENRKFECLKTVKGDHHLKWLGKQTATVGYDMVRLLSDTFNLPITMLMKGAMRVCRHTPTAEGPFRTASERSLMRQTGELVADVGAVVWDGLLLLKGSLVTSAKATSYLSHHAVHLLERLQHLSSDKESPEPTVTSGPADLQKNSSDQQVADHLAHDMSNTRKETLVTSAPGETIMGDSSSKIMDRDTVPLLRTVGS